MQNIARWRFGGGWERRLNLHGCVKPSEEEREAERWKGKRGAAWLIQGWDKIDVTSSKCVSGQ